MSGRILAIGGHETDEIEGNDLITDRIVELSGLPEPRVCLLATASGDPEDQIARFHASFRDRGCATSEVSLFRLGGQEIDLRGHLLSQDVIYVGGGSLINLLAVWRAHGIEPILTRALDSGTLVCGQSAGAMCWFELGISDSSGSVDPVPGFGVLPGSLCVHYHSEPGRRARYLEAVAGGAAAGYGVDDQAALLFEDGRLAAAFTARSGAGAWRVEVGPDGNPVETPVEAVSL